MKSSPFDYTRAQSHAQALEMLASDGDDVRLIAGGQSLVPMMAMRLATPTRLVDINRLDELAGIRIIRNQQDQPEAVLTGAITRQCQLQSEPAVSTHLPLVAAAMPWLGHQQTRNRGTVGGSLAQADPSAELPLSACILNAKLRVGKHGAAVRHVDSAGFFEGPLQTVLAEDEMLTAITWPVWQTDNGESVAAVFDEVALRHGDFAMASAACQMQVNTDGVITRAAFGLGGVDAIPLAYAGLVPQLVGQTMTPELAADVTEQAIRECDPGSDIHASAQYRRHLAGVLLRRVLQQAANQAKRVSQGVY